MQMSGGEKNTAGMVIDGGPPLLFTISAVNLNSGSGSELKLYLDWKRNTLQTVFLFLSWSFVRCKTKDKHWR